MSRFARAAIWLQLSLLAVPAAAAPFVNLNFEQAMVPPGSPQVIPAALGVPGWTAAIGGVPLASIYYNYTGIGEGAVTLYDTPLSLGGFPVLEGNFSIALFTDNGFDLVASLSQTGDVPAQTRSIRLLAPQNRRPPFVKVNGSDIPLVRLSPPGGSLEPAIYGGDVTAFAGLSVGLELSSGALPIRLVGFDAVTFSPTPIPEPIGMLAVSWALAILRVRRRLSCRGLQGALRCGCAAPAAVAVI